MLVLRECSGPCSVSHCEEGLYILWWLYEHLFLTLFYINSLSVLFLLLLLFSVFLHLTETLCRKHLCLIVPCVLSYRWVIYLGLFYVNTCWVPHLEMSPRRFTVANLKQKVVLLQKYWWDNHATVANGNICTLKKKKKEKKFFVCACV